MQEIVSEILKVEEKSARMIEEARRRAAEEKEAVDAEVAEAVKRAREQALSLIRTQVESANVDVRTEHDRAVAEAQDERMAFTTTHASSLDAIVDKIVKLIVSPEYETR